MHAQHPNELQPEKWTRAVINIEKRPGYYGAREYHTLLQRWQRGELPDADFEQAARVLADDAPSYNGTGIFFTHGGRYYLITARHVLEDMDAPGIAPRIVVIENGAVVGKSIGKAFISGLNSGPPWRRSYIFAPDNIDLVVLSLDNPDVGWDHPAMLKNMGYVPVELPDIDAKCMLQKDQLIHAVGFAGGFSMVARKALSPYQKALQSDLVSFPVVSEGRVGDDHTDARCFMANIFLHSGSNGAPIVSNNMLVGIVSGMFVTEMGDGYLKKERLFIKPVVMLSLVGQLADQSPGMGMRG